MAIQSNEQKAKDREAKGSLIQHYPMSVITQEMIEINLISIQHPVSQRMPYLENKSLSEQYGNVLVETVQCQRLWK